jgi:transglutaminase-like putative cysteine protease
VRLHIRHETTYRYDAPVGGTIQMLRLSPRQEPTQRVVRWIVGSPGRRVEHQDAFGNIVHLVTMDQPRADLTIIAGGVIDIDDCGGRLPPEDGALSPLVHRGETRLTRMTPTLRAFAEELPVVAHPDALLEVAAGIHRRIEYVPGSTDVDHEAAEVLELGKGVCQDHAHVFLAVCRARGIAARYVSGYLHTGEAEVASHAWVDVWLGADQGWFSLDVTHARPAGERHCRLAVGRDYLDACPVRGVRTGGGAEAMSVRVFVAGSAREQQQQQ